MSDSFNKNNFQFIILGSIYNLEQIVQKFNCKIFNPSFGDYLSLRLLYSATDLLLSPSKLEAFGQEIKPLLIKACLQSQDRTRKLNFMPACNYSMSDVEKELKRTIELIEAYKDVIRFQ